MHDLVNRRWLLTSYPDGVPSLANWTMDTQPVPDPGPSQALVRAKWLSVDPYMRGRMSAATNYAKGVGIGEVMQMASNACRRPSCACWKARTSAGSSFARARPISSPP
jgi:NADPH-dependent curcumin reductase CurA